MKFALREQDESVAVFCAQLPDHGPTRVRYETHTGALVRVNGVAAGAFDREHDAVVIDHPAGATLEVEVELRSLPTHGLPSGPGLRWRWLNYRAQATPASDFNAEAAPPVPETFTPAADAWPLIGHSHLDVAWLWTYEEAARKAMRTFAIAENLLERYAEFRFAQSQPQLYAFVEDTDAPFFERIARLAAAGRFDASIAALWVEPDCNIPSGESLLRQMLYAHDYCTTRFGVTPSIAWLPDSFGFCNTLPTLLAHAGIRNFATTKLQWNDTTRFPHPQFVWRGPDGSEVLGALIASYDGGVTPKRIAVAKSRQEPVIAGYGDGGGGVTEEMIQAARGCGTWISPQRYFDALAARRESLPVHRDELYLEYHRGVYTTHHDIKARNAALERKLEAAEEAAAWCVAVRAPRDMAAAFRSQLHDVWQIVLRNQFHDVLPGTSVAAVYDDVRREYDAADQMLDGVLKGTRSVLPRAALAPPASRTEPPLQTPEGEYVFDNGHVHARVTATGTIVELRAADGRNVAAAANAIALYHDRPKKWEAWNIDAGYNRRRLRPKPGAATLEADALVIPFTFGPSTFSMRITLGKTEPFLRVELDCDWHAERTLLRIENWLAIEAGAVTYGTPHGTISRDATASTPAARAKYEVPGQRFAAASDASAGMAILALDTYGWSARALPKGGIHVGHSLLRATTWPDPTADRGRHRLTYAFAPFAQMEIGKLERWWTRFAHESRVRLFDAEDGLLVVACKPAHDGEGVIVRVRECDGQAREARVRCAGRVRAIRCVDALERDCDGDVSLDGETIVAPIGPFALRAFRVQF